MSIIGINYAVIMPKDESLLSDELMKTILTSFSGEVQEFFDCTMFEEDPNDSTKEHEIPARGCVVRVPLGKSLRYADNIAAVPENKLIPTGNKYILYASTNVWKEVGLI